MSNSIDIILPAEQLEGTSATLSKWLVSEQQAVESGEPIIELETDKVSMEICAPVSGVISQIVAGEGQEVEVDTVLGTMKEGAADGMHKEAPKVAEQVSEADDAQSSGTTDVSEQSAKHLIGPAVRRLIQQHDLDISLIDGSGRRGRVTRDDVRSYLQNPQFKKPAQSEVTPYSVSQPQSRPLAGKVVPHSNMRKAIANHMVESLLHTSPHVTSVFEMDMSNIIEHRKWHKKEFAELGTNLTFTAYFLSAVVKAVQQVPQVNARFHDHGLEIFDDINIGVGTALGDQGLVVPVVQQVQSMQLFEIAKSLTEQTEKARSGKMTPADMKNGTFTISNHGVSGSLFAAPIIINQPQVAILGIGKLEKRVVVEEIGGVDTMVIKPMCYVSLSIDHRALDAHQTNSFLAKFVEVIESWGE